MLRIHVIQDDGSHKAGPEYKVSYNGIGGHRGRTNKTRAG